MPKINITNEEWQTAHQHLDTAAEGTKLPYSVTLDENKKVVTRRRYEHNPKPYQTSHSFIKISGKIYAIAQGKNSDALLPDGSMSRVKYGQTEDGTSVLIKIPKSAIDDVEILYDLSQALGETKRIDKKSHYIVLVPLGLNLKRYFKQNQSSLDDEKRLNMAIETCWQVFRLHEGHASKTQTPYAHHDLKLDNLTIDADGHIHIIDYGTAEKYPNIKGKVKTGMYYYVAYKDKDTELTKRQYDNVALRRILFMPSQLYCDLGHIYVPPELDISILTEEQLSKYKINDYINTFAKTGEVPNYSSKDDV